MRIVTTDRGFFYFEKFNQDYAETVGKLTCEVCDCGLYAGYELLIETLAKADLLQEDFVPLCCCCYHVLQPQTTIKARDKCSCGDILVITEHMNLDYDSSFLEDLKLFGSDIQKKFYSKITGEKL